MTPELDRLMDAQAGVATARQADCFLANREARRTLMKSGVLRELRHGALTSGVRWNAADHRGRHRLHLAGALLLRNWSPDAARHRYVGSHRTAAFLLDLRFEPDPTAVAMARREHNLQNVSAEGAELLAEIAQIRRGEGPRNVDVIDGDRRRRTYGHHAHVRPATLPPEHVVLDHGVPITTMARTAVDLMRDGTRSDALIVADGALFAGVELAELREMAEFSARWANGLQALETLALADGRAESAAESLARFVCLEAAEIPEPEVQVDLYDAFGHIARVDLLFRRFRVVLEVDGLIKVTDPWCGDPEEAIRRQIARENRLRRAGWTVIRTTWEELVNYPNALLSRLLAAFAQAA